MGARAPGTPAMHPSTRRLEPESSRPALSRGDTGRGNPVPATASRREVSAGKRGVQSTLGRLLAVGGSGDSERFRSPARVMARSPKRCLTASSARAARSPLS